MQENELDTIWVCCDCLFIIEYGENEDWTQAQVNAHLALINEGLGNLSLKGLTATCDTQDFSWNPCQVCQSALGGARHEIAILNWTLKEERALEAFDNGLEALTARQSFYGKERRS